MDGERWYCVLFVCPGFYSSLSFSYNFFLKDNYSNNISNCNNNNNNNNINNNETILFILLLKLFLSHSMSFIFILILLPIPQRGLNEQLGGA